MPTVSNDAISSSFSDWICHVLQFDLLVELFQDELKAISPTGQAPGTGGRTRLSIKPDKSRDTSSKEHKKTVGCQVDILSSDTLVLVPAQEY